MCGTESFTRSVITDFSSQTSIEQWWKRECEWKGGGITRGGGGGAAAEEEAKEGREAAAAAGGADDHGGVARQHGLVQLGMHACHVRDPLPLPFTLARSPVAHKMSNRTNVLRTTQRMLIYKLTANIRA